MTAPRLHPWLTPLPTKPDAATLDVWAQRVRTAYLAVTEAHLAEGRQWYPYAHSVASEISGGHARQGAGVLAALSAQKRWPLNVSLAWDAFEGNVHGHTGTVLAKVRAILAGQAPEDILPMHLKTGHFYRCIAEPDNARSVVIDRHAHDIVAGTRYGNALRGLDNTTRYESIADAYRLAALDLGALPSVVQAVTWVAHTEAHSGDRIAREGIAA